tara:strand:+ start:250 stop:357 length:108 start_codon:yes stop_codon:yes gene_type:complete
MEQVGIAQHFNQAMWKSRLNQSNPHILHLILLANE